MGWPTSPTTGAIYQLGPRSWIWNGSAWDLVQISNAILILMVFTTETYDGVDSYTVNYV